MTFSMLEIYNEDARDLLVGNSKKSALKIRQHPKKGFYGAIKKNFEKEGQTFLIVCVCF